MDLLQQLFCMQHRMRASVVMEHSPNDYHLFQHLKRLMVKWHFSNDDDVQTGDCHRLAPFSGGRSLQHQCTEIGVMVQALIQKRSKGGTLVII
ncbi:hypothetical protein AVEN_112751-1 [Araneus ventricosus]|uniref:Uncharacterized protein n=1 Tax=Araneus ventricosus TaxID=182803 RepID=A0A4Y2F982_ARAVE|nr:hypothetical protein AVEN_112751-1 [Araneus ventricosus]